MKTLTLLMVMFCSSMSLAQTAKPEENSKQKIVVHLSQGLNDLRAATMAFRIAEVMQKKAQVTMFLDQEGGRWADPNQKINHAWGSAKAQDHMDKFLRSGGKILVCPVCLDENGTDPKKLRKGFEVGTVESISQMFLEADKVIDF